MKVLGARLLGSWPSVSKIPDFGLPEIALIGRSNVGKSSLVNRLLGRKSLARVSATPGKTQEAVLFEVELATSDKLNPFRFIMVDLPGFGYAKVSKDRRKDFHNLIVEYISARKSLKGICLLNDCRRQPGEDELLIWEAALGKECMRCLVITKADKLRANEKREVGRQFSNLYPSATSVVVSGKDSSGADLQAAIFGQLAVA